MEDSLRHRKKVRTAETIERVANKLFQRQGFEATTVDQIAEEAYVHRQTVLRYFKSKEDIAFASRNRTFASFREGLESRTGTVLEYYRSYVSERSRIAMEGGQFRRWAKFVDSDERLFAYQLRLNQKYIETLANALSEEAKVDPRRDIFSHSLAAMLTAANYDVARMAIRVGDDEILDQYSSRVIDLAESLRRDAIEPVRQKSATSAKPAAKGRTKTPARPAQADQATAKPRKAPTPPRRGGPARQGRRARSS
jgi:AcrR family transcriptional regulator